MKSLLSLALFSWCAVASAGVATADATAKFLAGLPVRGTAVESLTLQPAWAQHATEFDRAWVKVEQLQLAKIRTWAPAYLGDFYASRGAMFYPFSGPDFLYANAFYPAASTYLLCGIEPVGAIPQLENIPPAALESSLATLRKSLESSLNWSFFITKNMKVDLTQTLLTGTLPVLYVFLARAGCTIDSVELVALSRDGAFVPPGKGAAPGVKIVFFGAGGRQQTLYYFASDLSDSGVRANPGFLKFCGQQATGLTLLKAASFLMHEEGFSKVRSFLLANSAVILQDDSGIPYRFLADAAKWKVRFCGRYVGPIDLFKQHPQPDLARDFARSVPVPIAFGFGYQWHPSRSSLMIATPRASSPATLSPTE